MNGKEKGEIYWGRERVKGKVESACRDIK